MPVGREGLTPEKEVDVVRAIDSETLALDPRDGSASCGLGAREHVAGVVERIDDVRAKAQRYRRLQAAQVDGGDTAEFALVPLPSSPTDPCR